MKFCNTETKRQTTLRASGQSAASPKGLGRDGYEPLMQNRAAFCAIPNSNTARNIFVRSSGMNSALL